MINKRKELIKLKRVSKFYYMGKETVKALDGIDFKVYSGEFVAIMGTSGSGKTTAMNMVGSLDVPTKGKVFLDGHDISTLGESRLAQIRGQKIGFIFQSFNLIANLTAIENVMLPMTFQGTDINTRRQRAKKLLELVELDNRLNHYPGELSGGQRQRVAIARSLANDPEVILADEPTGNLDSKRGEIVMEFLHKLNSKGKTIVLVTHDLGLAEKNAEIIYWLKDGKIEKVTRKKGKRFVVVSKKVFNN